MSKEKLQHWRCPDCGRLYSDSKPFVDAVYCLGAEQFVYRPPRSPHTKLHWVKMKRFKP